MFAKYDADLSGNVNKAEFFTIMQAFALFGSDTINCLNNLTRMAMERFLLMNLSMSYMMMVVEATSTANLQYTNVGDEDDNTESYKSGGSNKMINAIDQASKMM